MLRTRRRLPAVMAAALLFALGLGLAPAGAAVDEAAAADPLPANDVDPGVPGPYATLTGEYALPDIHLPRIGDPLEMKAIVVAPRDATGPRPLVLFLHGVGGTCYDATEALYGEWPCQQGRQPIPNYRGYLQTQQLLASQGYVTVSIAANGILRQIDRDGGAQSRSSLVRRHLAAWAGWAAAGRAQAPEIVRSAPVADLSRVLLVGHSRGGEGVNRAVLDSLVPPPSAVDGYDGPVEWTIRGQVHIAPTIFGQNPVAEVPSVTILPGCDGDVGRLEGQEYVDGTRHVGNGAALHSALYVPGANHNFFNTEWTPGLSAATGTIDDSRWLRDPLCSATSALRLTPDEQRAVGATYVAAAAWLFLSGDDRVRPLLDGSGRRAPTADPAGVLSAAVGAYRRALVLPDASTPVTNGKVCLAVTSQRDRACLMEPRRSPHFGPFLLNRQRIDEVGRYAIALSPRPGRTMTMRPRRPVDLDGFTDLALRIAVSPNVRDKRFDVAVVDTRGRRTPLGHVRLDGLPSTEKTIAFWAQEVRVPLAKLRGKVAQLELTPRDPLGEAVLIDAWGWRAGTPELRTTTRLRVDVGEASVTEGPGSGREHRVPVVGSGRGSGLIRLYAIDRGTHDVRSWVARVTATTDSVPVPFALFGPSRLGDRADVDIRVKAVRGVMVGDPFGRLARR